MKTKPIVTQLREDPLVLLFIHSRPFPMLYYGRKKPTLKDERKVVYDMFPEDRVKILFSMKVKTTASMSRARFQEL